MGRCTELLFIGLFLVRRSFCSSDVPKPKIAIVGAGIGGASASHFLTELFDGNLEIDIFESDKIGGRMATVEVGGKEYEAGGSVIHSRNKYMTYFVELLGMEKRPPSKEIRAAIWNGGEFVITESDWEIVTLMKLLYRYGLQPFKLHRHINSILKSFETIYQNQDDGLAYDDVLDLLSAMSPDFPKLLEISTSEYLKSLGYSKSIIDEVVEATLVVNYGQDTDVQSFVGCISVAGAGADLWAVKGGNKEVPTHLIYRNSKASLVPSRVKSIRYFINDQSLTQYEISYNNEGSNNAMKNIYDIVVLATPLTKDLKQSIEFLGFPNDDNLRFPGTYQTTVATFVQGDLNISHFGLEESIDAILSCDPNKTEINSVSKVVPVSGPTENASRVWKVFSKKSLTSDQISSIFSQVDHVQDIPWKAYPKYSANVRHDKFQLYDSLYHVNAIEWAASAMEMSAIAGRNVALLIHNKLSSCCRDATVTDKGRCGFSCKEEKVPRSKGNTEL